RHSRRASCRRRTRRTISRQRSHSPRRRFPRHDESRLRRVAAIRGRRAMSESPTLLFCTSHIASEDAWRTRYLPWIDYYEQVPLRRDATYMFDDASPFHPSDARLEIEEAFLDAPDFSKVRFHRFATHLGRDGLLGHLGWWRRFIHSLQVSRRYAFRR